MNLNTLFINDDYYVNKREEKAKKVSLIERRMRGTCEQSMALRDMRY